MAFTMTVDQLIDADTSGLLGKNPTWERVPLEDIAFILNGAPFDSSFFNATEGIPLVRIRDVIAGETNTYYRGTYDEAYLVKQGDLLVGMDGDFNSAFWGAKKALLNQRVCKISPNERFYNKRLLALALPGYLKAINANTSSVTVKHLSSKTIGSIGLPLPPRNEQDRIVEKLEELLSHHDVGVAELKAAQKKLGQYQQSLLKAAVEGALTANWREVQKKHQIPQETGSQLLQRILAERRSRWEVKQLAKFAEQGKNPPKDWEGKYPEPTQPDISNLPELPTGWVWSSIDQLTVEQKYGSSSKTNEDSTGVPVLRMGNIQNGTLDIVNLKYLPAEHDGFPSLYLQDGDLLFNRTNSPELVGKTAVYRSQIAPCSFASYLISVRFSQSYIPELASTFINSAYGKHWIKSVVVQQVGQANVNGSKLAALAIPLPPFKEQKEIVSSLQIQLDQIVEQLMNIDTSLKQSAAQRKNILKTAFSGQLVPQDPKEESASVLLERIRAERAAPDKQPKVRKTKQQKGKSAMIGKLTDVLAEAGDWIPAQEAFRRCGVADGALTDQLETLYGELRALDKAGRLAVEVVTDSQGRKLYDRLKLLAI
jgi:type I restriction enzyme S subunit